ncbi:MAG TPA: hypothetical protein P5250_08615, partial [Bacteroidales bacterium]|nr:hypothetical protein [Bacteroidales bacterium]
MTDGKLPRFNTHLKTNYKKRYEFFIFLLCLSISFIIWLMIKLSKEYTTEIVYPLKYTNLEKKQLLITDAPKNLVLYITANGYRLLQLKYLRKLDSLQIDLTNIKLHKENNSYYGWIKTNDIIRLNKQLFPTKMVSVVKPDTLQFEFESVATKKVNINPNLNLDFAPLTSLQQKLNL